jgi:cytochrome P450
MTGRREGAAVVEGNGLGGALPPRLRMLTYLQAGYFYTRPVFVLLAMRKQHGSCFRLREPALAGRDWWVWVSDPDAIRELLDAGPDVVRPSLQEEVIYNALDQKERADRPTARELIDDADERCPDAAAEVARSHVASWPRERPYRLIGPLRRIVVEALMRGMAGVDDTAPAAAIERAIARERRIDITVCPNLRYGDGGPRAARRLRREQETVASLLAAALPDRSTAASERLAAILVYATEASTMLIAWALERLMREPQGLATIRSDLEGGSNDYRDAAVASTLWTRPPILSFGRRLLEDRTVCGYRLPAGTMVRLASGIAHVPSDIESRPDVMHLDRFLPGGPDQTPELAFGSGLRRRLGDVVTGIAREVVGEVARAVDLERTLDPPELARFQRPTYMLKPNGGARAIVVPPTPLPATAAARDLVTAGA